MEKATPESSPKPCTSASNLPRYQNSWLHEEIKSLIHLFPADQQNSIQQDINEIFLLYPIPSEPCYQEL
ncbi:MAG: hypothetical protein FJZ58_06600 [Chlamydiae bacterium]|nr:hypothetical protein [Chlamydiota bacterium]